MVTNLKKLLKFQLLLTVFLTPLLSAQFGFGYEQIKVAFFLTFTLLTGINFLYLYSEKKIKLNWSLVKTASTIFICIILLTSLTGVDPWNSIIGIHPYFQGFLLYLFLYFFSIMVASVKIPLTVWAIIVAISTSLVSIRAVDEFIRLVLLNQNVPNYAGRVVSSFGQPNLYSGFLLLGLPFLFLMLKDKKLEHFALGSGIVSSLAVLLSQSRAAIALLLTLFIGRLATLLFKGRLLFAIFLLAVLMGITGTYFSANLVLEEIVKPQDRQWLIENSPEKRTFIWMVLADFIQSKPILGYGLENLRLTFPDYVRLHGDRSPAYYGIKNLVVDRSHNYILDLLFFSGILGLLAWFALILVLVRKLRGKTILLTGTLLYLVWIQLQVQSIVHLLYFWLLIGISEYENTGN